MTLERCMLTWPDGDRFYFLSPDGDRWLEVAADSYRDAPDHADDIVAQLTDLLEGRGRSSFPIHMSRSYLDRYRHSPGYDIEFD